VTRCPDCGCTLRAGRSRCAHCLIRAHMTSGRCIECGEPSGPRVCESCVDAAPWPEPDPDPYTWGALLRAERAARGA